MTREWRETSEKQFVKTFPGNGGMLTVLEVIAEHLKVRVAVTHKQVAQFARGDICWFQQFTTTPTLVSEIKRTNCQGGEFNSRTAIYHRYFSTF